MQASRAQYSGGVTAQTTTQRDCAMLRAELQAAGYRGDKIGFVSAAHFSAMRVKWMWRQASSRALA